MKVIALLICLIIPPAARYRRMEETYKMIGWDSKQMCLVMLVISKERQIILWQEELPEDMRRSIFGVGRREDE